MPPPPCKSAQSVPTWCMTNATRPEAVVAKAQRTSNGRVVTKSCVVTTDLDRSEQEICSHMSFSECGTSVTFDASKCLQLCCDHGLVDRACLSRQPIRVQPPSSIQRVEDEADASLQLSNANHVNQISKKRQARDRCVASDVFPGVLQNNHAPNSAPEPRPRGRRLLADLSDEECFHGALNDLANLHNGLDKERDSKMLRSIHTNKGGRDASLLTGHVLGTLGSMRYVGVMWQTTVSPPRCVVITFFTSLLGDMEMHRCSCNPHSPDVCWHRQVASQNHKLMSIVRSLLCSGDDASRYFGDPMPSSSWNDPDLWPSLMMTRISERQQVSGAQTPAEIAKKVRNKWAPWARFDVDRRLFLCITKRPHMRFQCQLCRNNERAACDHEDVVRHRAKQLNLYDITEDDDEDSDAPQPEDIDAHNPPGGGGGFTDMDVWSYCPLHVSRPLLPCKAEQVTLDELYNRIRSRQTADAPVVFKDALFHCKTDGCGENIPYGEIEYVERKDLVTLLTLECGPVLVKFHDWKCGRCNKQNCFSGHSDGIFPVRKHAAYSTDYLYCLLDLVCRLGLSQRNAYESLNIIGKLTKKLLQLETVTGLARTGSTLSPGRRLHLILQRRRVSEALSLFYQTLNYGASTSMQRLFNCDKCEQDLTDADRRTLGLRAGEGTDLKRYKGIVIDGTACGILSQLPEYCRCNYSLSAPRNTGRKYIINKRREKRILKEFLSMSDAHIKWMMRDRRNKKKHFFLQAKKAVWTRRMFRTYAFFSVKRFAAVPFNQQGDEPKATMMHYTEIHVRIIGSAPIGFSGPFQTVCIKFSSCPWRQALFKRPPRSPNPTIPTRMIQERTVMHLKSVAGVVGREGDHEVAELEV